MAGKFVALIMALVMWAASSVTTAAPADSGTSDAAEYARRVSVGDFVCHYGKTTHYGCGWIVSKVATPCGGINPVNTAIKVDSDPDGTGFDLSEPGDSGGPWFSSTTALGTMSCQQGFDAIYVATNYIESGLGATIATN